MINIILATLLTLAGVASGDERYSEKSVDHFHVGFSRGVQQVHAMTISSHSSSSPAVELENLESFERWVSQLPKGTTMRFDGGCVVRTTLPVGRDEVLITRLQEICSAHGSTFIATFGW